MYKVKCYNPIAERGLDMLGDNYTVVDTEDDINVALVRSAKLHDTEFNKDLFAIARAGAGVNNIPLQRCAEEGIVVFNTPGANANAVKELVVAGMIMASRNIPRANRWVNENIDDPDLAKSVEKNKKQFVGREVIGKRLGVIGLGAIGIEVANACADLGMEVVGYDPYIAIHHAFKLSKRVAYVRDLNEVLSTCDYITIHTPAVEGTKGLFNKENIDKMKDGVILLNFARPELIVAADLKEAIDAGRVQYYVTDFPNEDTKMFKNFIAIPHLGASTEEAEENCAVMAVDEVKDFIENGNILHSVNYPDTDMGPAGPTARITILHKNKANMLGQFTSAIGNTGLNIDKLVNQSREDFAYTMLDVDVETVDQNLVETLNTIDGVIRVRVIA
ncbi:MAG: 3-phosphoglycerate dehydrogenase family protein [Eubacteriales bacterium]|nr:3-phosphoglycerate dehydrogenase family protein [Eubacteriales bacterium]